MAVVHQAAARQEADQKPDEGQRRHRRYGDPATALQPSRQIGKEIELDEEHEDGNEQAVFLARESEGRQEPYPCQQRRHARARQGSRPIGPADLQVQHERRQRKQRRKLVHPLDGVKHAADVDGRDQPQQRDRCCQEPSVFAIPRSVEQHRREHEYEQCDDEMDDDIRQLDHAGVDPVVEGYVEVERELRDYAAIVPSKAEVLKLDLAPLFPVDLLDQVELAGIEEEPTRQARGVDDAGEQRSEQDTAKPGQPRPVAQE